MKRSLTNLLVLVISATVFTYTTVVKAEEEVLCAPEYTGPRRIILNNNGATGIWFAWPVAECLLRDVNELRLVHTRLELLDKSLEVRDNEILTLRQLVRTTKDTADTALVAADTERRLRKRCSVWWRSPYLWAGVGLVLGIGLTSLTTYIILSKRLY
jgi:hypothetical protein